MKKLPNIQMVATEKKTGYEEVAAWINTAYLQIKPHTIVRSFQTTGLYHATHNMNLIQTN